MKKFMLAALLICLPAAVRFPAAAAAASDYKAVGFEDLSNFDFEVPEPVWSDSPAAQRKPPKLKSKIPDDVRALDGKKVEISGYILPLEQGEGETVKKFILMRNQITCCFGGANRINEYIMVTAPGKGVAQFVSATPITVQGTLFVGAQFEDGVLTSLYQMNSDAVVQQ